MYEGILRSMGVKRPQLILASTIVMILAPIIILILGSWQLAIGFFAGSWVAHIAVLASLTEKDIKPAPQ